MRLMGARVLVAAAMALGTALALAPASDAKPSRGVDFASVKVGPLRVKHKDVGALDQVSDDNVAIYDRGGFSIDRVIHLGARSVGFGGTTSDVLIVLPRASYDRLIRQKKGTMRIINTDAAQPGFDRDDMPDTVCFLDVDFLKFGKKKRTSAELELLRGAGSSYHDASGRLRYRRIQVIPQAGADILRYRFTLSGRVGQLIVRKRPIDSSEDSKVKTLKRGKLSGSFVLTIDPDDI